MPDLTEKMQPVQIWPALCSRPNLVACSAPSDSLATWQRREGNMKIRVCRFFWPKMTPKYSTFCRQNFS